MFGFSLTGNLAGNLLAFLLSSFLALDLPLVTPGPKHLPSCQTREEYSASRQWVPASSIPAGKNGPDLRVFSEGNSDAVRMMLRDRIEQESASIPITFLPQDACTSYIEVASDRFAGGVTLDAMLRDSTGIYTGTIVSEEPGFFDGIPVLLLRLRIQDAVLPASDYRHEFIDVFYPHAHFALHGYKVCGIPDEEGVDPRVGDRALVFAAEPFPSRGIAAWLSAPQRIAIQAASGRLSLPKTLRLDRRLYALDDLSEVGTAVRHALSELNSGAR
jgi:hypothetical protein